MKAFVLSDLHYDFYEAYAVEPARLRKPDPPEDVNIDTLEYIWNTHFLPETLMSLFIYIPSCKYN